MKSTFDPYSDENLRALEDKLGISMDRELLKRAISTRDARNGHPD